MGPIKYHFKGDPYNSDNNGKKNGDRNIALDAYLTIANGYLRQESPIEFHVSEAHTKHIYDSSSTLHELMVLDLISDGRNIPPAAQITEKTAELSELVVTLMPNDRRTMEFMKRLQKRYTSAEHNAYNSA